MTNKDVDVLRLCGSPEEMGHQHGEFLKDRVRLNIESYARLSEQAFGVPYAVLLREAKRCERFIPPEYREELLAISAAADVNYEELLALNCAVDVDAAFSQSSVHCCNFVVGPPMSDGDLFLHGRNLDFPHLDILPRTAVVIVRVPRDGALPTVAISWAGYVGILTGMNKAGVSMADVNTTALDSTVDGVPVPCLIRKALETGTNLDEVAGVVEGRKRTCGSNFAVTVGNSREASAFETTPSLFARRDMSDGFLIVDDVCLSPKSSRNRLCHPSGAFRHARMMQLIKANEGRIGID